MACHVSTRIRSLLKSRFLLGPAINDALANVGRTSTEELTERYGHIGFQWKHEYEADLAAIRLLARAGFDTQQAADYFSSVADLAEMGGTDEQGALGRFFKLWSTTTHPSPQQRTAAIQAELHGWSDDALKAAVK